jgi:hypothetical protein
MEWEIKIHNDEKYLEIITSGIADKDGSMKMAKTIADMMKSLRFTRVLVDHENLTEISGKILDVYQRPSLFKIIGVILGVKIAEIIKPEHLEHFKFLETVCLNRGYKFSVFHDKTKAIEWLLK